MNHSFNVGIATLYGVQKAVLIENIAFWISKNIANKANFNDGKYWTYNSASAFRQLFPYFTISSISRWLVELEKSGVLVSSNFNKHGRDKTKWYTIVDPEISSLYNLTPTTRAISQNERPISQNERPLPYINTIINTPSSPCTPVLELTKEEEEAFIFLKEKLKQVKDLQPLRDMAVKHGLYSCKKICGYVEHDIKMKRVQGIGVLISRLLSSDKIEQKKKASRVVSTSPKVEKIKIESADISNYIASLEDGEKIAIHKRVFENIGYNKYHCDEDIINRGVSVIVDSFKRSDATIVLRGEITPLILDEKNRE